MENPLFGPQRHRRWEKDRGAAALQPKKDRREDIERDKTEQQQLALSAQNFALTTVVSALVDHARASDPQLVERIESAIALRHACLQDTSNADREFQEKAIRYLSLLTSPLG